MLFYHYTKDLLNLQDVKAIKLENFDFLLSTFTWHIRIIYVIINAFNVQKALAFW